jgi:hypothetical protein
MPGERDVVAVPPLPVAGLVAAGQQQRRPGPDAKMILIPGRPRDPGRSSFRW